MQTSLSRCVASKWHDTPSRNASRKRSIVSACIIIGKAYCMRDEPTLRIIQNTNKIEVDRGSPLYVAGLFVELRFVISHID